jgi:hypothetical protein
MRGEMVVGAGRCFGRARRAWWFGVRAGTRACGAGTGVVVVVGARVRAGWGWDVVVGGDEEAGFDGARFVDGFAAVVGGARACVFGSGWGAVVAAA